MKILGIYLGYADKSTRRNLKNKTWYGFNISENLHDLYKPGEQVKFTKKYDLDDLFLKHLYGFDNKNIELSVNAIVGKNGSGKSTLLDIQSMIINNFAYEVKNKFNTYNKGFKIIQITNLQAELYYEITNKIHCIKIDKKDVYFSNEEEINLFDKINNLKDLSTHCFYTITNNYSIYTDYPKWKEKIYHKNDGYFTPIVLVPYRRNGNIEMEREKKLAEKRVQTISLLAYKDGNDFIEDYIPYQIKYKIIKFKEYQDNINEKMSELSFGHYTTLYSENTKAFKTRFDYINDTIIKYWDHRFNTEYKNVKYKEYCKQYLIYKTLKVFLNYESIFTQIKYDDSGKTIKDTINTELWDENNINYINLKILMCKKFMLNTCRYIYKPEKKNSISIKNFLKSTIVNNANTYDEMFILLLPDFFKWNFYYIYNTKEKNKKKQSNNEKKITELSTMSSGEQQLYNALSYIIYHIKNANSNKKGNQEGKIPYTYFNVVFDEAELYYHPEYQRRFIKDLITVLNKCNLGIEGINITLVTHSPFILSDIPRKNIIALDNGDMSNKLNKTLGANIYDLLKNQFFMSSTIGENSRKIIEKMIAKDFKIENKYIKTGYNFYNEFIENLGDDYFQAYLCKIINNTNNKSFKERKIDYYNSKIKELNEDNDDETN